MQFNNKWDRGPMGGIDASFNFFESWPLDPPLNALSWNLIHMFSGSFLYIKMKEKKLEFPEMGGSALPGGVRTPLSP